MSLSRLRALPQWAALAAAALGALVYFLLAWRYAHSQASVLDEGLYLYKGWLFASGRYTPFQDFGPWSNHMPLSFLLPGWVQVVFGAGLRTGRYFALACGLLIVLAAWLLARRFGGGWWGAGVVWALALNPAVIKIYSIQASQGLAACILVWALVLTLGKGRPLWQLLLGVGLAAALPLTRINLFPVLPLLMLYVFRVHGRQRGAWAAAVGLLVFAAGHAAFWPGILRMWAPWFPSALTPFLEPFRRPANAGSLWDPQMGLASRLLSFLQGLRFHFLAVMGAAGAIAFWPRPEAWPDRPRRDTAVLLISLFLLLAAMHAWASLGKSYCVFCFPVYLSFFSVLGLLALVLAFPHCSPGRRLGRWIPPLVLVLGSAFGAGAFDSLGPALLDARTVSQALKAEVPRLSGQGTIPLWGLVENRFGLDFESSARLFLLWGRVALSLLVGLAGSGMVLVAASRWRRWEVPFGLRTFAIALAAGLLFSPTPLLGGGYRTYDCRPDVIAAYEQSGTRLSRLVPAGGRVYWGTGESPVPLLYLPEAEIYPAQLNGAYSFKFGGDPEALERFGHWNLALAKNWAAGADAILLSPAALRAEENAWLTELVSGPGYREAGSAGPVHPCAPDSQILVFVRE